MAALKVEELVRLAKQLQSHLGRVSLLALQKLGDYAGQVPDMETLTKSLRHGTASAAQSLQNLEAFQLRDPQKLTSAEELLSMLKSWLRRFLSMVSQLPSSSAVVLLLLSLRASLALGRCALPVLREVLDGQILQSRSAKLLAALPSLLLLQKHRGQLTKEVFPMRGYLEAFLQLCHNAKPLPPLFWASFAFAGLQGVQVAEGLSLSALHLVLRFKRLAMMLLICSWGLKVPWEHLREKYMTPAAREALMGALASSWKLIQDLVLALRAAALHGAPKRVAPGEVFGSPSSEDRCVVTEIQPPVFAGNKTES